MGISRTYYHDTNIDAFSLTKMTKNISQLEKEIMEETPHEKLQKRHSISMKKYHAIHHWLKKNFGKANQCENIKCEGLSPRYEWSLKKGMKYEEDRNNFEMLCRSCHAIADLTEEGRKKLSDYSKGKPKEQWFKDMMSKRMKGRVRPPEERLKISMGHKRRLLRIKQENI